MEKQIEDIIYIIKKILPEDVMQEIKKKRREELDGSTEEKKKEEFENIKDDDKIKKLVENNYLKDYFINIKNAKEKILVMGINPGGGTKISLDVKVKEKNKWILCFDSEKTEEDSDENELLKLLEGKYIFQNYHYQNYKLFKGINGRLFWSYYKQNELLKLIEEFDSELKFKETFNKIYKKESNKTGPCIVYGDLFWYADGKQKNIKDAIEIFLNKEKEKKELLNDNIKALMDKYIEMYKPIMIVVTNAYASDLIKEALGNGETVDKIDYKNIPIIFSGMVSGQRTMDKYSYMRLKSRIEEIYENIKKKG